MSKDAYNKPLSFDTTMRNPERILSHLKILRPYEGKVLSNQIIDSIIKDLFDNRIIWSFYQKYNSELWDIYSSEDKSYTPSQLNDLLNNSADGKNKKHKEAGFDKGWPSRFATRYSLAKEFGLVDYSIGEPIKILPLGHMLIDADESNDYNKIQSIFLNILVKYPANNPLRKTLNNNVPLMLLLNLLQKCKENISGFKGISRKELPLLICWPNDDVDSLYKKILEVRKNFRFNPSDEYIYDLCLSYLIRNNKTKEQLKKEFKISKITKEAVDDFIRKVRITGILSLRGNGRFLDFNMIQEEKIKFLLSKYPTSKVISDTKAYLSYINEIEPKVFEDEIETTIFDLDKLRKDKIEELAITYSKAQIKKELQICGYGKESTDELFKFIDKPIRLEFLTSICLTQHFDALEVIPNYKIDDEGLPTCTASGGMADIVCIEDKYNSLFEVTLMCGRQDQVNNEIVPIRRHLLQEKENNNNSFSVFIAPRIHVDAKEVAMLYKHRENLDILTYDITEFIDIINTLDSVNDLISA